MLRIGRGTDATSWWGSQGVPEAGLGRQAIHTIIRQKRRIKASGSIAPGPRAILDNDEEAVSTAPPDCVKKLGCSQPSLAF